MASVIIKTMHLTNTYIRRSRGDAAQKWGPHVGVAMRRYVMNVVVTSRSSWFRKRTYLTLFPLLYYL